MSMKTGSLRSCLLPKDAVSSLFQAIDRTAFGKFVRERSQSFVAINSSIADIGYIMYALTAGAQMSVMLIGGMVCKISGIIILLADDKKGAAAARENHWPSHVVLFLHRVAKAILAPVRRLIPPQVKKRLPNAFSGALLLYGINGMTYVINGGMSLAEHMAFTHLSQTLAGITMTIGGMSFAISGLEKNHGANETKWSRRGQYAYAITPIFCIFNLASSIAAGQAARSFALALVTSMAIFQIYVRHNFKRQRPVAAMAE